MRVGLGFDVHPWAAGRPLWLGGIRFDGVDGLEGHSDGDVVCHAVADAFLGALALGDVGQHLPDTDPSVAGVTGERVLTRACELVAEAGHRASGCDATVICDRPAIAPRRDDMRRALAGIIGVPVDRVSVKATRPEGLGLVGDGVGCLALATVIPTGEVG
jgi:2-C-methyl-D-erythritol 4-phosphate cytidylyltransferase/2-C-methyl-D-erythritol 2,4-cyclodiphosphate synthase